VEQVVDAGAARAVHQPLRRDARLRFERRRCLDEDGLRDAGVGEQRRELDLTDCRRRLPDAQRADDRRVMRLEKGPAANDLRRSPIRGLSCETGERVWSLDCGLVD